MCETNYWRRLHILKLYSLQRRRERYLLFLLYRMIVGIQTPIGFHHGDIKFSERRNITITPILSRGNKGRKWVQTLKHAAFPAVAITTYNILPAALRTFHATPEVFKSKLDSWLATIPDEPDCTNQRSSAPSNSIVDQVTYQTHNTLNRSRLGSGL